MQLINTADHSYFYIAQVYSICAYIQDWITTTHQHLSQIQLKDEYQVKEVPKKMINEDNIGILDIKR